MALISFYCQFSLGDEDSLENLKLKPETYTKLVRVNTEQICSFQMYKQEKGQTEISLSNGESYIIHTPVEDFEDFYHSLDDMEFGDEIPLVGVN